jgi:hypothetical protein
MVQDNAPGQLVKNIKIRVSLLTISDVCKREGFPSDPVKGFAGVLVGLYLNG